MVALLVQSLKGGADLPTALGVVADMGPSPENELFSQCRDHIIAGMPVPEALALLDDGFELNYLSTLMEVNPTSPDRIHQLLTRLEYLNRHSAVVSAEIKARMSSMQTTSVTVFVLVPFIAVLLLMFSPWYQNNLQHHVVGQVLLIGAIVLYAVGGFWLISLWNRQRHILRIWQGHSELN
ncbi:MAG: hypothetical protein O2955_01040 [Planctomycetota bacterium]|nr:hypothetical protein [Planctomycetota bacterium]MDA1211068.1 hypothetical protein [Planctomycetota bacterium]